MDHFSTPTLFFDYPSLGSLTGAIPDQFDHSYAQQYGGNSLSPLPLHAPVPLPPHVPFLHSPIQPESEISYGNHPHPDMFYGSQHPRDLGYLAACEPQVSDIDPGYCATDSLQSTFPTPSELLAELAAKGLPNSIDEFSDVRSESASKTRRRAMAKSIGFIPTDPDTISSHEKKRHYLECLEQYILYLHQQFELVGVPTPKLERDSSYRGLGSKSIRTLLVHMENTTRNLNLRILAEEQTFMTRRDEIVKKDASNNV